MSNWCRNLRWECRKSGQTGGQGRNRTSDTVIFSHVLYQLSYLASDAHFAERTNLHYNMLRLTHQEGRRTL